jgi:hypothetical protein
MINKPLMYLITGHFMSLMGSIIFTINAYGGATQAFVMALGFYIYGASENIKNNRMNDE